MSDPDPRPRPDPTMNERARPHRENHPFKDTAGASGDDSAEAPTVPGFVVGRMLGRGGTSCVWLVSDGMGRRFALKIADGPFDGTTKRPPSAPALSEPSADTGPPRPVPGPGRRARRAGPVPGVPGHGVVQGSGSSGLSISWASSTVSAPSAASTPGEPAAPPGEVRDEVRTADQLLKELEILRRMEHPHLLRVHRMTETNQGPGLLMDLAAGGSLLGLVTSRGPLPIPEVVTTLVPIAQALGYLHDGGAVHGDVTPANILFTHEGKPLLADLGTGRLLGADPKAMPGTPGFVDPSSGTAYDAGVDVFALAAVSWFALTGRVPGPSAQRPPLALIVPDVPGALMQLIEDSLSADRARRPSASDFAHTLLSTADPGPVNLVPAVHASVLPELLTRRSEPGGAVHSSHWQRMLRLLPRRARQGFDERSGHDVREPGAGSPPAARTRPGGAAPRGGRATSRGALPLHIGLPGRARSSDRSSASKQQGFAPSARSSATHSEDAASESRRGGRTRAASATRRSRTADELGQGALRRSLAVASGVLAVLLLAAGLALTVDGLRGTEPLLGEPAVQGAPAVQGSDALATAESAEPGTPETPADPVEALDSLVAIRASAFTTADADVLSAVDVEDSPAMTADRAAVGSLEQSGRALDDLSITLGDARLMTGNELAEDTWPTAPPGVDGTTAVDTAVVRATAQISSYTENPGPSATTAEPQDTPTAPSLMAAGRQELFFVLWLTDDGWRIHSVVEPPS